MGGARKRWSASTYGVAANGALDLPDARNGERLGITTNPL
jgi:hypothetical protein